MKIAHIGDTHLGMTNFSKINPLFGLNDRLADYVKCLHFAVDTIIEQDVECVLFVGDAYKNRFPDATQRWHFESEMLRLIQAGIYIVAIIGNHDSRGIAGSYSSLDSLRMLHDAQRYVTLANTPDCVIITGKHESVCVSMMPWPTRQFLIEDVSTYKLPADQMYAQLKGVVDDRLLDMNTRASQIDAHSHILIGHLDVDVAEYSSERAMVVKANLVTEVSLLRQFDSFGYIGLGHIHKHQNIGTNVTPIVYCGSIERVDFSEEGDKKGFCIFDIEDNNITSFQFIETPARNMWTLTIDLTDSIDPTLQVGNILSRSDLAGSIARVKYATAPGVDVDWQALKPLTDTAFFFHTIKAPQKTERTTQYALEHTTLRETLETYLRDKQTCTESDIHDVLAKAQSLLYSEAA